MLNLHVLFARGIGHAGGSVILPGVSIWFLQTGWAVMVSITLGRVQMECADLEVDRRATSVGVVAA